MTGWFECHDDGLRLRAASVRLLGDADNNVLIQAYRRRDGVYLAVTLEGDATLDRHRLPVVWIDHWQPIDFAVLATLSALGLDGFHLTDDARLVLVRLGADELAPAAQALLTGQRATLVVHRSDYRTFRATIDLDAPGLLRDVLGEMPVPAAANG